jgi:hypothetical protein
MNTKNKQDQKHKGKRTRQEPRPKKRGQSPHKPHEQELPETRMFR